MARYGVTYEEVKDAIESIQEAGMSPTIDRVREVLKTGSKTTISSLMNKWRKNCAVMGVKNNSLSLPDELNLSVKKIYDSIQASAEDRIEKFRVDCKETIDNLNISIDEAKKVNSKLQADLEHLKDSETNLIAENKLLTDKLISHDKQLTKLSAKLEEYGKRIDDYKIRLDEKKQENKMIRENFDHYCQQIAEERQREREESHILQEQLRAEANIFKDQCLEMKNQVSEKISTIKKMEEKFKCLADEKNEIFLAKEKVCLENNLIKERVNFLSLKLDEKENLLVNLEKNLVKSKCL
ncbi:DNA-binding protein, partial [Candidatus Ichthyocystis hellenicum]|uniref:DNA-binding protein n=2 Tax=Candidatus Ichthyocystis TaxID=2929841 RepID=UPI000B854F8F